MPCLSEDAPAQKQNILEAGTMRKIRINREYLAYGDGKPYVVDGKGYDEVTILGPSRLVIEETDEDGCGLRRIAFIETDVALEVS